jgi:hypothetical protein
MRVLVACEYSGKVRDAFTARGHFALSCDLLPSDSPNGWHYRGDVRDVLNAGWDMLVGFPPCTHLAVSGARWFAGKRTEQEEALAFFRMLWEAPIGKICLENPVSIASTHICKPSQVVQPYQFGHGEVKKTCLWLKGLPLLVPTDVVEGRVARVWRMGPSPDRAKKRSETYQGIADAMANQWNF